MRVSVNICVWFCGAVGGHKSTAAVRVGWLEQESCQGIAYVSCLSFQAPTFTCDAVSFPGPPAPLSHTEQLFDACLGAFVL